MARQATTSPAIRRDRGRPHRSLRAALVAVSLGLAGCFEVDATLDRNGSGTLQMTYVPMPHATIDSDKAKFSSPHVTVQSITPSEKGTVLKAAFDDVTRLSTAEGFRPVTVRRERVGNGERLRILIQNPKPVPSSETGPVSRFAITLPGRVQFANRDAEVRDNRVVWRVPLEQFVSHRFTKLSVRYAAAGA